MDTRTAAQIHHYDQRHAMRNLQLDALILAYRDTIADGRRAEAAVAAVAHYLMKGTALDRAEILACAVERLARCRKNVPDDTGDEIMPE